MKSSMGAIILGICILFVFAMADEELPAGISGYCYYCNDQGQPIAFACSVDLYLKRSTDGKVFTGNSRVNEPHFYVANASYRPDVLIEFGPGYSYYVKGYKYNPSGPYSGGWEMAYTGPFPYTHANESSTCPILLKRIPGQEPEQGGNE